MATLGKGPLLSSTAIGGIGFIAYVTAPIVPITQPLSDSLGAPSDSFSTSMAISLGDSLSLTDGVATSLTTGGGTPTFDATMTVRTTERNWVDVTTPVLAAVPAGNKVTVTLTTLSGGADGFTFSPWQYPGGQAPGPSNAYAYAKREIGKWTTIDTSGSPVGSGKAWLTFSYKNGAAETGTTVNYVLGINVVSTYPTTWAMGAKSLQRQGGPLLSKLGTGTGTAITQIKDHTGAVLSGGSAPFEVFYGRLVWAASGAPGATSYGTGRQVSPATAATQTPYTVTLDNGDVLTINAIANQWDVNPPDPAMVASVGGFANYVYVDPVTNTIYYNSNFAHGDVIMLEDGVYFDQPVDANSIDVRHRDIPAGTTTLNSPAPPTAGTFDIMDIDGQTWPLTITSRTPWGAQFGNYNFSIMTTNLTSTGPGAGGAGSNTGYAGWRVTNVNLKYGLKMAAPNFTDYNADRRIGVVAVDHCYQDVSSMTTKSTTSGSPGFIDLSTSSSPGGRHHIYCHDNWAIGNTVGISGFWEDGEIVGNRVDYATEDAIRYGLWDTTPGSRRSKCMWNVMTRKWWGLSSHPDYIQMSETLPNAMPGMTAVYPVSGTPSNPATFTSTFSCVIIGNIGIPDSDGNNNTDTLINSLQGAGFVPTNDGTVYQMDDGEGFLGVDMATGRFYEYLFAGNIFVSTMTNGFYAQHPKSTTRFNYNTMIYDHFGTASRATFPTAGAPIAKLRYAGDISSGNFSNSFVEAGWANTVIVNADGLGTPATPSYTNVNTTTYTAGTITGVMANPTRDWTTATRIQDVLDAVTTTGAEASRGAVADKTKVDHRNRTWDTSIVA